ncbi:hypothetical protein E8E11_009413 [Didymella keratinophila]|nr:hypothetical protein E8E11_009413 [Didymella keratinophila]
MAVNSDTKFGDLLDRGQVAPGLVSTARAGDCPLLHEHCSIAQDCIFASNQKENNYGGGYNGYNDFNSGYNSSQYNYPAQSAYLQSPYPQSPHPQSNPSLATSLPQAAGTTHAQTPYTGSALAPAMEGFIANLVTAASSNLASTGSAWVPATPVPAPASTTGSVQSKGKGNGKGKKPWWNKKQNQGQQRHGYAGIQLDAVNYLVSAYAGTWVGREKADVKERSRLSSAGQSVSRIPSLLA